MASLHGRIAVVAGASRGAGKGIALALGDAGATVYVAGRTSRQGAPPIDGAPGTIEDTADEVRARGGIGISVRTDCTVDADVAALFEQVRAEQGRVDLLANAVWGMSDAFPTMDAWMASMRQTFWQQRADVWTHVMDAGPRAYFLASRHAARLMAESGGGLIVGLTDGYVEPTPGTAPSEAMGEGQLLWELSHLCINRLMKGMAAEGKKHKIAVVTLMPGFMRTERVVRLLDTEALKRQFGFDRVESTEYLGRAVAALAADRRVMRQSGQICFVADLATQYGFTDVDGRTIPRFNPMA